MKKTVVISMIGMMVMIAGAAPGYAHKAKSHPTVKHAIHELHEAKAVLGKLKPDADGHIVKASQAVEQAVQELSAVK